MKKLLLPLLLLAFSLVDAQTTHQVSVTSNVFTPASLTIEEGDIVEWTCTQGSHNINGTTADYPSNPEGFGNGVAPATWTFSHTFTIPGSYDYKCDPHEFLGMTGTITVNPCSDPVIEFATSIDNRTVDFTNTTVDNPLSVLWDFGDGNTSTQENPQHTYAADGTYTVCLTGTDNCGTDSTCQAVTVSCPVAESAFTTSENELTVDFTDESLNNPTSWLWDFGDGNTSTQQSPQHSYAATGNYAVCLTVVNDCGVDSSCQAVQVSCPGPEVQFTTVINNLTVDYTNSTVDNLTSLLWDYGDGNTTFNQQAPQHTFPVDGTYVTCLTGTNQCGTDSSCQNITVACPVAESVFSTSYNELTVDFTDESVDNPTSWLWDFGDGNTSTQQSPQHSYAQTGNYAVCLTVVNDCGADSSCQAVQVSCPGPEVQFTTVANNLTVDFTNATVDNLTSTLWDFGDGNTSTQENPQHTFPVDGTYTVCLTGTNQCGTDSSCQAVPVSCPVAESDFLSAQNGYSIQFTDESLNNPTAWLWDLGDGNTSTQQNYNHTYAATGTYTVCLTVVNDCGTDSSCQAVSVTVPDNDDCANATLLTVGQSCNMISFDSENQSAENPQPAPNPSCGFFQGSDVWFRAVVPTSGALRIERDNGSINVQFAVYSGTCGNMEEVTCAQLDEDRTIHRPDLAGQEVYIRVWNYNSTNGGTFDLCVWEPEIPINNYCADAIELTVGQQCVLEMYTGVYATADTMPNTPNPGCGFYQGGDVWFTFDMPASGELRIERENINGNAQYAVYDGTCGNFSVLDCAQLDGATTLVLPDQAGQTLYLRVWGYNTEEGAEFELCLWDPPVPVNDLCANAIPLPVGDTCSFSAYSSLYATTDTAGTAPSPGCGFYQGGDVWFTVDMPATGMLHLERDNINGNAQFALYEGTCGNFTSVIDCAQLTSEMEVNDQNLAGETLYLRVFGYNSEEGAEFEFCAYDTTCNNASVDIVQMGGQLDAGPGFPAYWWYDCSDTSTVINSAQVFTPNQTGSYRVCVLNGNGCLVCSECEDVLITGIAEHLASQVQVYPNPSTAVFEVELNQAQNVSWQVFDITGKAILEEKKTVERFMLNLSGYADGIYSLRITTSSGIQNRKLLLQR